MYPTRRLHVHEILLSCPSTGTVLGPTGDPLYPAVHHRQSLVYGDIPYWTLGGPSGTRTPPSTSSVFFGATAQLRVTLITRVSHTSAHCAKRYLFEHQKLGILLRCQGAAWL
ncbi:hypothetical protein HBI80_087100 [Parastagonospora nodorum]|nr:hypothetical protein HBI80_087100 [Parastagonospora nodorum]